MGEALWFGLGIPAVGSNPSTLGRRRVGHCCGPSRSCLAPDLLTPPMVAIIFVLQELAIAGPVRVTELGRST
jgi:hypothetical protein